MSGAYYGATTIASGVIARKVHTEGRTGPKSGCDRNNDDASPRQSIDSTTPLIHTDHVRTLIDIVQMILPTVGKSTLQSFPVLGLLWTF